MVIWNRLGIPVEWCEDLAEPNMSERLPACRTDGGNLQSKSDVQQVSAAQVDYAGERKRIVYCRDPEGNLLELCAFQ